MNLFILFTNNSGRNILRSMIWSTRDNGDMVFRDREKASERWISQVLWPQTSASTHDSKRASHCTKMYTEPTPLNPISVTTELVQTGFVLFLTRYRLVFQREQNKATNLQSDTCTENNSPQSNLSTSLGQKGGRRAGEKLQSPSICAISSHYAEIR